MFKFTKALLAGLTVLFSTASFGAAWPERPITLVVPFTPGTGIDLIARQLAAKLPETLGQPVVVENLAGASGSIGTERVARATPRSEERRAGKESVRTWSNRGSR